MAPSESEVYIQDFLSKHTALDADLGAIKLDPSLTKSPYTNEEWASHISKSSEAILTDVETRKSKGEAGWQYEHAALSGEKEEALLGLAQTIDHTVLKLEASSGAIDALCDEARTYGFKSVCVRLPWVQRCVSALKGSASVVASVVGFHEGTQSTPSKLTEARAAVAAGAAELDVVLNHSLLTSASSPSSTPDYAHLYTELISLRTLCPSPTVLKLILETSQLSDAQILAAAHLASAAEFDFIKTSTGFNGPGATLPHVKLMVAAAECLFAESAGKGERMQVKASGGIRGLKDARGMLGAGATRLGTSGGLKIVKEAKEGTGDLKGDGASSGY